MLALTSIGKNSCNIPCLPELKQFVKNGQTTVKNAILLIFLNFGFKGFWKRGQEFGITPSS